MNKGIVTKDEVRQALESFQDQGISAPGLHRLQKMIGHGSFPRIKRLLGEIQNERIARFVPGANPPPDEITEKVQEIWAAIDQAQSERERELNEKHAAEREALLQQQESMQAEINRLLEQANVDKSQLTDAEQEIEQLKATIQQRDTALAEAVATIQGKDELIRALELSKRDIVAQMVRIEQQTAEREHALNQKITQFQTERIELEKKVEHDRNDLVKKFEQERDQLEKGFDRERREADKTASDLRDIVTFLRTDAERQRNEHQKALEEKSVLLCTVRDELDRCTEALAKSKQESEELRSNILELNKIVAQQQQDIATANTRAEVDEQKIRELEALLAAGEKERD